MRCLGFGLLLVVLHGAALAAGPFGGTVYSLQMGHDGNTPAWAATSRGLFRHADGSWHRVPELAGRDLRLVLKAQGGPVAVGAEGQLFSSLGEGGEWAPLGSVHGRYGHQVDGIYALVPAPEDAGRWFLGTAGDGPFETVDRGASWTPLSAGLEAETPPAYHAKSLLAPRGERPLLMGTWGRGLFFLREGAWTAEGKGLPARLKIEALAEDPSDPAHLALGSRGDGLWESWDAGARWKRVRKGSYGVVGPVCVGHDGTVLAHFPEEGLVRVRAGKASRPGPLGSARVLALTARTGGGWFAGLQHDGVVQISAEGDIVGSVNEGLDATRIASLGLGDDGTSVWAGDSNGVFFSGDGGGSWEARDAGLLGASANVLLRSGGELFLGSGGQGVYRWDPVAGGWVDRSAGLGTANTIFSLAVDSAGKSFYVGTEGGVLRSDDRGGQWARKNAGLTAAGEWRVCTSAISPSRLWAAGGGTLYRSDDGGDAWSPVGEARPVMLATRVHGKVEELLVLEQGRLSRLAGEGTLLPVLEAGRGEQFRCVVPSDRSVWVGGAGGLWACADGVEPRKVWGEADVICLMVLPDGDLLLGIDGAGVVRWPAP